MLPLGDKAADRYDIRRRRMILMFCALCTASGLPGHYSLHSAEPPPPTAFKPRWMADGPAVASEAIVLGVPLAIASDREQPTIALGAPQVVDPFRLAALRRLASPSSNKFDRNRTAIEPPLWITGASDDQRAPELPLRLAASRLRNESSDAVPIMDFERFIIHPTTGAESLTLKTVQDHKHLSLVPDTQPVPLDPEHLVALSLYHSFRAKLIRLEPEVRRTDIQTAVGAFDWTAFIDNTWSSKRTPTGSELDAGAGANVLEQDSYQANLTAKKRNRIGGEIELSQALQTQTSNSSFLTSPTQATSDLSARFTQEFLRNSSGEVAQSKLAIAGLQTRQAEVEALTQLNDHVQEVLELYWQITRVRCQIVANYENLRIIEQVVEVIRARFPIDATPFVLSTADAARVARLESAADLQRELATLQGDLVQLVNMPDWALAKLEFIPLATPHAIPPHEDWTHHLQIAMANRPEIRQSLLQIEETAISSRVARNQLLPRLASFFQLSSQVRSFKNDFIEAQTQVAAGRFLSAEGGFLLDFPVPGNGVRGNARKAQIEYTKSMIQLEEATSEVQRDVANAQADLSGFASLSQLRVQQVEQLLQSVKSLDIELQTSGAESSNLAFRLTSLVNSVEQLTDARFRYYQTIADQEIASLRLARANGLLLSVAQSQAVPISESPMFMLPNEYFPLLSPSIVGTAANHAAARWTD